MIRRAKEVTQEKNKSCKEQINKIIELRKDGAIN